MRKSALAKVTKEEQQEIDLTPMLDVVFIMLIFFIVTASFVKEPGVDVQRVDAVTATAKEDAQILIAITSENEIWMDKEKVEEDAVRYRIEKMLVDTPESEVVVQADARSDVSKLALVFDAAKKAGADPAKISVSTQN